VSALLLLKSTLVAPMGGDGFPLLSCTSTEIAAEQVLTETVSGAVANCSLVGAPGRSVSVCVAGGTFVTVRVSTGMPERTSLK